MKDMQAILNANFVNVLSHDMEKGSMDGVVSYAGVLTGVLSALYEKSDSRLRGGVEATLQKYGIDINIEISNDQLRGMMEQEELPDNVVRIH